MEARLAEKDHVGAMERYFGDRQGGYELVLAPLYHGGGFGFTVADPDGRARAYYVGGPRGSEDGLPVFADERLSYLVFHEFTHSFVNPLVDRWAAELRDAEDLFGPVQEFMVQQSYPDWITTLKEHLVRATDIRIVGRMSGAEAQEEA